MITPTQIKLPTAPAGKAHWPWTEEAHAFNVTHTNGKPWPRISIVTLSYNQGEFIEEALRSVLLQGYPNLEYIVIDGGSTDGSVEVIKKYEQQLSYWSSERDGSPAAGLNNGFQRATGDVFGFLNADDLYLPGSLHRVGNFFRTHAEDDVLYGDGYMTEESGRMREPIFSDLWNLWRMAYGTSVIVQPATFFRKQAFLKTNGFNEELSVCWDAGLWVDLALSGATFHHARSFLGVFRLHSDSITGSGRLSRGSSRDMNAIFTKILGRKKRASDRGLELLLRLIKFSTHPHRTLIHKLFLHSIRNKRFKSPTA